MDRRTFVRAMGAAATAAGVAPLSAFAVERAHQQATLKQAAAAKGILYGSSAWWKNLQQDADFVQAVARECAIITPEAEMKMGTVLAGLGRYNFGPADVDLQFAQSHGLKMRGHTLVFWESIPKWLPAQVTSGNARQVLTDYIQAVCGHYAGQLHSWDVVNEVIDPGNGNPDGLKNSIWLSTIGPDYIPLAFQTAHQADPSALMVLNQGLVEYAGRDPEAFRTATLKLLEKLKGQNVPVQALGIQGHLYGDNTRNFNATIWRQFLKNVSDMGLKILITEMDVQDKKLPQDPAQRDQLVAQAYSTFLDATLQNPAVIVVQTWGIGDRYTWLRQHAPRPDGDDVRVLPLDRDLRPKDVVYQAILQAFQNAPPRAV